MADSAIGILSLEQAKRQLQIDEGTDLDNDDDLTDIIEQAVNLIARLTGLPLIDTDKTVWVRMGHGRSGRVVVPLKNIKSYESIKYWETSDEAREEPEHTVDTGTLGRTEELLLGTLVYPPSGHWPAAHNSLLQFTCKVGIDLGPNNKDIRTAVILVARQISNGHPEITLPRTLLFNLTAFATP